ncbi:MAG: nucleotidyltransferase domain-containing protein [Candidatus Aenigmatarchaeota archaeon]|nr:MAG: nucleotidyltransferase domain-containing protein [Candidatus Aenigmarchaeota archaeon]
MQTNDAPPNVRVIGLFRQAIKERPDLIGEYKAIALFGSVLHKPDFNDVDLVTCGNIENNEEFLIYLKQFLEKEGFEVDIFVHVAQEPKKQHPKHIIIQNVSLLPTKDAIMQDLWRNWPDLINEIVENSLLLHGSWDGVPHFEVREVDFYRGWLGQCGHIDRKEGAGVCAHYIEKMLSKLAERHPRMSGAQETGRRLLGVFAKDDWVAAREEATILLVQKILEVRGESSAI